MLHHSSLVTFLVSLLLALSPISSARDDGLASTREYIIKAKMMHNFTNYATWPDLANHKWFSICILGENPILIKALQHFFKDERKSKVKNVRITQIEISLVNSCQILFISSHEEKLLNQVTRQLDNQATLMFSDTPGFAEKGSHINFYIENSKVRFEINHLASTLAGVKISSRVLAFAKLVGIARG